MLTEFGIAIRKIRLDRGEILKNMADKLNVSSAFLSAVENGKRSVPEKWLDEIDNFYHLSDTEKRNLENAYVNTEKSISKVNLNNIDNVSDIKKWTAFVFARSFEDMPDETAEQILKILKKNGEHSE